MRVSTNWMLSLLAVISFGITLFGQDQLTSINGPILGFVQDPTGAAIQPVIGVVGASVIGQPLSLGSAIRNTVVSPKQDCALAVRSDTGEVVLIRLGLDSFTIGPIDGAHAGADLIAISPTGAAAAVYGENNRTIQSVTGLPEAPKVGFEFDVSDIPGRLQAMAIADDGRLALLTFITAENSTLWAVSATGSRWFVPAQRPSAANFLANRHDALIADDAAQEVFIVSGIDQEASRFPVASFGDGFDAISGIAASDDGLRVFITSKKTENVTLVDLERKSSTALPCHCQATGLHPLKGTSVFRLSDLSGGPVAVLDASSAEPRIIVLPVAAVNASTEVPQQ